jgi:uncharacterized protein YqgV (UPF0045/DUF77 family)
MKVQVEVSIYPLREKDVSKPIDEFCRTLRAYGLEVNIGSMSSFATGECENLFDALQEAFKRLAEKYQLVMISKISNTCPEISQDIGSQ